ncbi:MAG: TraR/DksA family transcriptional regulator [Chloroflexota bacterium]
MSVLNGTGSEMTREMLLRERAAVLGRIQVITQDALNFELESDGIPPSGHEGEQALIRMLDSRLENIDGALERIGDGHYGLCASCSKEIPPRRLEALPFATLCVACQSVADKRGSRLVHN